MNETVIDRRTRRAATTVSRRGSLASLGALALFATGAGAAAAKGGKGKGKGKAAKKAKKQAQKKCQQQVDVCREFLEAFCGEDGCSEGIVECCESFSTCRADEVLECIFAPVEPDPNS